MTIVETLTKARALIEDPAKWRKNAFCDHDGCFCMLGALAMAAEGSPYAIGDPAYAKARPYLRRAIGVDEMADGGLAPWNDAPERTHAEVLEAFDKAIALASLPDDGGM